MPSATTPVGGVGLLERAISYTLGSLGLVSPALLGRATPCAEWDLGALLRHMNDSLAALQEAAELGHVAVDGFSALDGDVDSRVELAVALRSRACRLLGAWANESRQLPIMIEGRLLESSAVTGTGAIEIAVHGWDVARACGSERPIPVGLAERLLSFAPLLVTAEDRPQRFADRVAVSPLASAGDQLAAFLGRPPDWPAE